MSDTVIYFAFAFLQQEVKARAVLDAIYVQHHVQQIAFSTNGFTNSRLHISIFGFCVGICRGAGAESGCAVAKRQYCKRHTTKRHTLIFLSVVVA